MRVNDFLYQYLISSSRSQVVTYLVPRYILQGITHVMAEHLNPAKL